MGLPCPLACWEQDHRDAGDQGATSRHVRPSLGERVQTSRTRSQVNGFCFSQVSTDLRRTFTSVASDSGISDLTPSERSPTIPSVHVTSMNGT